MMTDLIKACCSSLKTIKNCTVYPGLVLQGFDRPSFMINVYDQNPSKGINKRLKNTVRIDILYFPTAHDVGHEEECLEVGESLHREFRPEGFKIRNRNLKITDNVLHFMFDVDYREFRKESGSLMQTMSQNTSVKEN